MIFFTSDEHYGHHNIIKYCNRPYANTDEMREALIDNHNRVVKNDDEVWHLGDFAFDKAQILPILHRLNGRHRLISGNHDDTFIKHRNCGNALFNYQSDGFYEVNQVRRMNLVGLGETLLCHLPMQGNDYDNRYSDFAPHQKYFDDEKIKWLIHGHIHGAWKIKNNMLNVGVDVWNYTPVSLEELADFAVKNASK